VERKEQLEAILKVAQQKAATARKLNRKKRIARRPVKVLEDEWRAGYGATMGEAPSAWTGKEGKLTKTLVKEYGFDRTLELFRLFLESWTERARDHGLAEGSLPSVGYMYVIRDQLFAEIDGKMRGPGPVPGHKRRGETDTEIVESGPAEGWGDVLDSVD
jgi:hypothetical protein